MKVLLTWRSPALEYEKDPLFEKAGFKDMY